ncbi:MAG: hypothetical protein V7629_13540 [Motiliproteus sp.]
MLIYAYKLRFFGRFCLVSTASLTLFNSLLEIAHKFASACDTLGFARASQLLRELDTGVEADAIDDLSQSSAILKAVIRQTRQAAQQQARQQTRQQPQQQTRQTRQ